MKKLMALIISAVMTVAFAATSFAGTANSSTLSLVSGEETVFQGQLVTGQDEDGCSVFGINLSVNGESHEFTIQVGEEGLVIGADGENYEVKAEDLQAVFGQMAPVELSPETSALIEYLSSEDFATDMETIQTVAGGELSKIMLLANQMGIVTVDEDGTLTVQCDSTALFALLSTFLGDVAANDEAFSALTETKLWSMLGLSEDGKAEQEALAQAAQAIAELDASNLEAEFALQLVASPDGAISCDIVAATPDMFEEISFSISDAGVTEYVCVDDGTSSTSVLFMTDSNGLNLSIEMGGATEGSIELALNAATGELKGTAVSGGQTMDIVGAPLDSDDDTVMAYRITGTSEEETVFDVILGAKIVNQDEEGSETVFFMIQGDQEIDLDVFLVNTEGTQAIAAYLGMVAGEEAAQLGGFSLVNVQSEDTVPHISGEVITQEQLQELFGSVVEDVEVIEEQVVEEVEEAVEEAVENVE